MITIKQTKRILKIIAGFALLAAGVIMLPLPGPGWLIIAAGLAILANEFPWAHRLLTRLKAAATWSMARYRAGRAYVSRAARRIARAVTERLWERERRRMQVADELLSSIEGKHERAKEPRTARRAARGARPGEPLK